MASKEKTRTPTATPNGNQGGARALPIEVKIALAFDVTLASGLAALAVCWGYALPAIGSAFACVASAVTLALTSRGGAA